MSEEDSSPSFFAALAQPSKNLRLKFGILRLDDPIGLVARDGKSQRFKLA
jgi:hypothetical protein